MDGHSATYTYIRKRKEESIRAFPEKHEGREYAVFFRSQDFQSEISGLCGNGSHPFGRLAVWQQQDKAAEEQVVQGGAQEIKVPKGMKERIILADGTKVWLNSGSCLTLSPGFGQTDRELQLEGEGMFEVAKDKHKPFIIRSGDIRVRVTGTVFNFKSYP